MRSEKCFEKRATSMDLLQTPMSFNSYNLDDLINVTSHHLAVLICLGGLSGYCMGSRRKSRNGTEASDIPKLDDGFMQPFYVNRICIQAALSPSIPRSVPDCSADSHINIDLGNRRPIAYSVKVSLSGRHRHHVKTWPLSDDLVEVIPSPEPERFSETNAESFALSLENTPRYARRFQYCTYAP